MCHTETLNEVTESTGQFQFLGEVNAANNDNWTVMLDTKDTPLTFKIDTGVDATVVSEKTFREPPKAYRLVLQRCSSLDLEESLNVWAATE